MSVRIIFLLVFAVIISCNNDDVSNRNDSKEKEDPGSEDYDSTIAIPERLKDIPVTIFSSPTSVFTNGKSTIIVDELIKYIDGAVRGSDIYVNVYTFEDMNLAEALARAHKRDVEVHVMVDSSSSEKWESNKAVAEFLTKSFLGDTKSEVVGMNNDISVNHHKHILLSKVKTVEGNLKNIVFSTSSNFDKRQYEVLQDAIVFGEDQKLYDSMLANWEMMKSLSKGGTGDHYQYHTYQSDNNEIIFHFLPMRENGKWNGRHPFFDLLEKVDDYESTKVRIGMSLWKNQKSQMQIVDRLMEIQKNGGQVELILRFKESSDFDQEFLTEMKELEKRGAVVFFLPGKHVIHSKYMLLEGYWGGDDNKWVIAGTTNFTDNAVQRAYDLITVTKDENVYDEYLSNFENIKEVFGY